jgi:hypothetical protein
MLDPRGAKATLAPVKRLTSVAVEKEKRCPSPAAPGPSRTCAAGPTSTPARESTGPSSAAILPGSQTPPTGCQVPPGNETKKRHSAPHPRRPERDVRGDAGRPRPRRTGRSGRKAPKLSRKPGTTALIFVRKPGMPRSHAAQRRAEKRLPVSAATMQEHR